MTLNEIFENEISRENKMLEMSFLLKNSLKKTEGNFCFEREKGYTEILNLLSSISQNENEKKIYNEIQKNTSTDTNVILKILNNYLYSSSNISLISIKERTKSLLILEGSCLISKYSSLNLIQGMNILFKILENVEENIEIKLLIFDILESSFIFSIENIYVVYKNYIKILFEFIKDLKGNLRKKSIEIIWIMIKILKENEKDIKEIKNDLEGLMGINLSMELLNIDELNLKSFSNIIQKFDDRL
eukprot:gene10554-3073_t